MSNKEYECNECCAVFTVDVIEESQESKRLTCCPFCGSGDIFGYSDEDNECDGLDDNELFKDEDD